MTWPSGSELVLLFLLAGWAAADTTAAFQIMVGQPLVMGWLSGCVVGLPGLGLFMGAALQLLWSRLAPVGVSAYPDVGPATVAGVTVASTIASQTAWAFSVAEPFPPGEATLACLAGFLVALASGRWGQTLTEMLRRDNARLAYAADRAAAAGSFAGVERENWIGVARSFARGGVLWVGSLLAFSLLAWLAGALSPGPPAGSVPRLTNPGPILFWWFGIAALCSVLWRGGRRDAAFTIGGAAAGLLLGRIL